MCNAGTLGNDLHMTGASAHTSVLALLPTALTDDAVLLAPAA